MTWVQRVGRDHGALKFSSANMVIATSGGPVKVTVFRCHPGCGAYWRPGHNRRPTFEAEDTSCVAGELVSGSWPDDVGAQVEEALSHMEATARGEVR